MKNKQEIIIRKSKKHLKLKCEFQKNIKIIKMVDHKSVVNVLDYFQTEKSYFEIFEHFKSEKCLEYFQSDKDHLNLSNIRKFVYLILEALVHIHRQGIIHRNLTNENILYNGKEMRIIGFSSALIFKKISKNKKRKEI